MKKGILITLGVIAGLVLVFVVVVAMQPNEFKVERSATMAAPPEVVFQYVNNHHKGLEWSPWVELDPKAKYTFEGPEQGEGAYYKWSGDDKVGEGDMTIVESKPNELVRSKLHFVRPMEDTCDVYYVLKPEGDKTTLVWTMQGKQNFMGKAFCMFMNMDKMVGGDFEKGLAKLKKVVEEKPKATDEPEPKPTDAAESPENTEEK